MGDCKTCTLCNRNGFCTDENKYCEKPLTEHDAAVVREVLEEVLFRIEAGMCNMCENRDTDEYCFKHCGVNERDTLVRWLKGGVTNDDDKLYAQVIRRFYNTKQEATDENSI